MAEHAGKPKVRFAGFTEDWEQRKVGEYYDFKNGLNKGKEYFGIGTPIVNFTDVFHLRGIYEKDLKGKVSLTRAEIANFQVKMGDIFFTRTSETIDEIGFPSVMLDEPKDTVFSGFVLRGRALQDDPLTLQFKRYVFFTDAFRKEMVKKSSITTRALTSGTAIKNMEFVFPKNKKEQEFIGNFFRHLDRLITLHQRKRGRLENIKKAMLEKMFPKNGADVPEVRFAGFTEAWEQRKLVSLCEKFTDGDWIEAKDQSNSGVRLIQTGNVGLGEYIDKQNNKKWISKETFERLNCEEVFSGDILISRLPEPAGRACIVPNLGTKMITAVDCTIVRTATQVNPKYLLQYLSSQSYFDEVNTCLAGGTRQRISRSNLATFDVSMPVKYEEQKAIGEFLCGMDHLITLHQRKVALLQNIKKACLEKMFV